MRRPDVQSVSVYGLRDAHTAEDEDLWSPLRPNAYPWLGPAGFGFSPHLWRAVMAGDADVAHLHAMWMYTSILADRWGRRTGRPYVTTANGMLDQWAVRHARIKKAVAAFLYERSSLGHAACLQVNSEAEMQAAREFGVTTPICVIPNGVEVVVTPRASAVPWSDQIPQGGRVLLYLGRLHPKKGLEALLAAWATMESKRTHADWFLAIAGWDQGGHSKALRGLAKAKEIQRVRFLGPQYGAQKSAAFQSGGRIRASVSQ